MSAQAKGPLEFRPLQGFLSFLDRVAGALGMGESDLYAGEEGIRAVAETKLKEVGIPVKPIILTGNKAAMTPRQLAEHSGFIKRRKRVKG